MLFLSVFLFDSFSVTYKGIHTPEAQNNKDLCVFVEPNCSCLTGEPVRDM